MGEGVFRRDDGFEIEWGGGERILLGELVWEVGGWVEGKGLGDGNDNVVRGKGGVDGVRGVGSDVFGEGFRERIVGIVGCEGFGRGFVLLG